VYNWALRLRTTSYFQQGGRLYHNDLSQALTVLKKEEGTAWLAEVSSVPLQQSLRHLDKAFVNFFEQRAEYPTYKKKHKQQSATYTSNAFVWNCSTLTLAKQKEPLNIVWSRPLPEGCTPSSVTVSKDTSGRYFISILVEENIPTFSITDKAIGIDLGLKSFLITSDGETIDNPKYYVKAEKKLAKLQRRHAKKQKGSKNREKARKKVAQHHARIADMRRDFQHQLSTRLVRENQTICLETLSVKNMVKNHTLAKAISDVGWSEFVRQLEYKAKWYGRIVVKIDRWEPTSKTCHCCGWKKEDVTLADRVFVCEDCGTVTDRDYNAACNIRDVGLTSSVCGGNVRRKQVKASCAVASEAGSSL
jgi:putative transposase